MNVVLRPYQAKLESEVQASWSQGARNTVMQLSTGGGKTAILSKITRDNGQPASIIAHRHELVSQISLALGRNGVHHNIIGSDKTKKAIAYEHIEKFGRSFFSPDAPAAVASVDTIIRRPEAARWAAQVTLWTTDEGHHVVEDNKWHRAIQLFTHPHVRGLLPTATPWRADGKGLGRPPLGSGVADAMVCGPPMRWLIDNGFLSDFDVACPPTDLEIIGEVGSTGDWSTQHLREAVKRSHIIGDIVATYKRLAFGRLGITFATDTKTAAEICEAYNAAGVPAATLFGTDDAGYRRQVIRKFENREILNLVVVDIVSEGFDLPAMEVASSGRPTQSLSLYMQQFGRVLRPAPGKGRALYIDHCGNIVRHGGTPDKPREWSLANRDKRGSDGGIGLRTCLECWQPFERYRTVCPNPDCMAPVPPPEERGSISAVEGDLHILSAEALAILRGDVAALDMDLGDYGRDLIARNVPPIGVTGHINKLRKAKRAQGGLRAAMAFWAGPWRARGASDREIQKAFYLTFGIDVMSAMALRETDATHLMERVVTNGL